MICYYDIIILSRKIHIIKNILQEYNKNILQLTNIFTKLNIFQISKKIIKTFILSLKSLEIL